MQCGWDASQCTDLPAGSPLDRSTISNVYDGWYGAATRHRNTYHKCNPLFDTESLSWTLLSIHTHERTILLCNHCTYLLGPSARISCGSCPSVAVPWPGRCPWQRLGDQTAVPSRLYMPAPCPANTELAALSCSLEQSEDQRRLCYPGPVLLGMRRPHSSSISPQFLVRRLGSCWIARRSRNEWGSYEPLRTCVDATEQRYNLLNTIGK
jgi:hypothetical protein